MVQPERLLCFTDILVVLKKQSKANLEHRSYLQASAVSSNDLRYWVLKLYLVLEPTFALTSGRLRFTCDLSPVFPYKKKIKEAEKWVVPLSSFGSNHPSRPANVVMFGICSYRPSVFLQLLISARPQCKNWWSSQWRKKEGTRQQKTSKQYKAGNQWLKNQRENFAGFYTEEDP